MSSKALSIEPVVKAVVVACMPEEAFRYFTADFAMWWPAATHSVVAYASQFEDKPMTVVLEPCFNGRIFERTRAGKEHTWGRVLVWTPPTRMAFSFHPGRDDKEAQTVEVTFSAAPEGTRVVLTHSNWDVLSVDAQQARESYDKGWEGVFVTSYREYIRNMKKIQGR